jgi:AbrB family looped-hinge helix DNA binding protein
MLTSKISSKGQVTIPKQIREQLGVSAGDLIVYGVKGNVVTLSKVEPFDLAYHSALTDTLSEWDSPEDDEAFGDL